MKKILTLLFPALLAGGAASAQFREGNYMVGGSIGTTGVNFLNPGTSFDFSLDPKVGKFVSDNFVLGATLNLGFGSTTGSTTSSYGIYPFLRYFFRDEIEGKVPSRVVPYIELGAGFGGTNNRLTDANGNKYNVTSNGLLLNAQPGLAFVLNQTVAMDLGLRYQYIGGTPTTNRLGLQLGFQIFLTPRELRSTVRTTRRDMDRIDADRQRDSERNAE